MLESVRNFVCDIDWRIVGVVFVGLCCWRRKDIAAAVAKRKNFNAEVAKTAENKAVKTDPVEAAIASVINARRECVLEIEVLKQRQTELQEQLGKLDFVMPSTTSVSVPVKGYE